MKKAILAISLFVSACGEEQSEIQDEVVRCEDFCHPSGIKFFEFKKEDNSICMCNSALKE